MSVLASLLVALLQQTPTPPATPLSDAQVNYEYRCKSCHEPGQPGAPDRAALRKMGVDAILRSLEAGTMKVMGSTLTPDERRAVAAFITSG